MSVPTIRARVSEVSHRVRAAAERADRDPTKIQIVAIAKGRSAAQIEEAALAGINSFGVYAADEFAEKSARHRTLQWHALGPLEAEDLGPIAQRAWMVQSITDVRSAVALDRAVRFVSATTPRRLEVLIQIRLAPHQPGVLVDQAEALARTILQQCPHLELRGFTCRRPASLQAEHAYSTVAALSRQVGEALSVPLTYLSMGDSRDYPIAIAHGATHLRLHKCLFG